MNLSASILIQFAGISRPPPSRPPIYLSPVDLYKPFHLNSGALAHLSPINMHLPAPQPPICSLRVVFLSARVPSSMESLGQPSRIGSTAVPHKKSHRYIQQLSPSEEFLLGLLLTYLQVRELAQRNCAASGSAGKLGQRWIQSFLRRNPKLHTDLGLRIDHRRTNGATRDAITALFGCMQAVNTIWQCNCWNWDETGIMEGLGVNGLAIFKAETRKSVVKSPESRTWIIIYETISPDGRFLEPLVIFKRHNIQQR